MPDSELTLEDRILKAAPFGEKEVRAWMGNEAAKYRPNWFWKLYQWENRNWLFDLVLFVGCVIVFTLMSDTPLWFNAVLQGVLAGALVVIFQRFFVEILRKGPVEWDERKMEVMYDGAIVALFRALMPNHSVVVQKLYRTTNWRWHLATVVWLVEKKNTGEDVWRGVSVRSQARQRVR